MVVVLLKCLKCLLLSSILLTAFAACSSEKRNRAQEMALLNEKSKDVEFLKGKTLHSVDSILGSDEKKNRILYVFNYYDCDDCIKKGFKAVEYLDKNRKESVSVIVSMFQEITSTQRRSGYRGYIYKDEKDLIRKELKYAPTPMMLILDEENRIVDVCIFDFLLGEKDSDDFLEKCLSIKN